MIEFFWCEQSRSSRIMWMLEELGAPYEVTRVDIRSAPRADPPGFRAASPLGKVPALRDGEECLADSAAICLYLADKYSDGRLSPAVGAAGRAEFLYWMFYTPSVIEPGMMAKVGGVQASHVQAPWGSWESLIDVLETRMTDREWVSGAGFSAADVMVGAACQFMSAFNMLTPGPALSAYIDRCTSRPAFQSAAARETELAPV